MIANLTDQIVATTEARIVGTQDWESLADCPIAVRDTIAEEVMNAMCGDLRHEVGNGNTDDAGQLEIDGQLWEYTR